MNRFTLLTAASAMALQSTALLAADYEVKRSVALAATPADVWQVVGDFCDVSDWHPGYSACVLREIDGGVHRVLTGADGAETVEKRIAQEAGLSYTYRMVSSPLPLEKFTATLGIDISNGTEIIWLARFASDDPAMEEAVSAMMDDGLAAIKAAVEGN